MEITEKWIAKAAGWRANKEGRDLFKQGAVIDSSRKGNIITGTLSSGAKPTKVTVKIHSDTDIDTVCPRINCRRTGELCGHAVALMLHSISDHSPQKLTSEKLTLSKIQNDCIPLRIDLPPTFPDSLNGGQGGISVKLSPAEVEIISATDQNLTDWLVAAAGKSLPPILGLRGTQALEFLRIISEHQRVFAAGEKVSVHSGGGRIPMSLTRDEDRINISLCPSVFKHGKAWCDNEQLFLWDKEQRYLMIHDVSSLWKTRYWQRIVDGNSVAMPLTEFLRSLDSQHDLILWDDDSALSDIPISAAEPSFTLVLDGSTQLLTAQLQAHYSPGDSLIIGLQD